MTFKIEYLISCAEQRAMQARVHDQEIGECLIEIEPNNGRPKGGENAIQATSK